LKSYQLLLRVIQLKALGIDSLADASNQREISDSDRPEQKTAIAPLKLQL
jgi:hypothetical protein